MILLPTLLILLVVVLVAVPIPIIEPSAVIPLRLRARLRLRGLFGFLNHLRVLGCPPISGDMMADVEGDEDIDDGIEWASISLNGISDTVSIS